MTIHPIITLPNARLRQPCDQVAEIDDDILKLIDDLFDTLKENNLLGMAAIMIGVHKRVAVINIHDENKKHHHFCMINPVITEYSRDICTDNEGCPSVPNIFEDVTRPTFIIVTYTDETGNTATLNAKGMLARVIQHEVDLCNGILFIDRLSSLKRTMIEKRIAKAAKRNQ